jgi:hypothetical protein
MVSAGSTERATRRALRGLERGDAEEIDRLLSGADVTVLAEAFADLLDGNARPKPLVANFVAACWEEGRPHAADRRARGKRTPAAPADVPEEPSARRRYLTLSLDAVSRPRLVQLFVAAAAGADGKARERATSRLVTDAAGRGRQEVTGPERDLVDRWIRELGASRPLDRLRLAAKLMTTLKADIDRTAVDARAEGATWREIGEALAIGPDTARKRFR